MLRIVSKRYYPGTNGDSCHSLFSILHVLPLPFRDLFFIEGGHIPPSMVCFIRPSVHLVFYNSCQNSTPVQSYGELLLSSKKPPLNALLCGVVITGRPERQRVQAYVILTGHSYGRRTWGNWCPTEPKTALTVGPAKDQRP